MYVDTASRYNLACRGPCLISALAMLLQLRRHSVLGEAHHRRASCDVGETSFKYVLFVPLLSGSVARSFTRVA